MFIWKIIIQPIVYNSRFNFLKLFLITVKVIWWKSDSPVSAIHVLWKLWGTLVNIKSICRFFKALTKQGLSLLGFLGRSYHKMIACVTHEFQYWNPLKVLFCWLLENVSLMFYLPHQCDYLLLLRKFNST